MYYLKYKDKYYVHCNRKLMTVYPVLH